MGGVATTATRWRRDPSARSRRTPRSVLVMGTNMDAPLLIRELGVLVWDALEHEVSELEIVEHIADGRTVEATRADVRSILLDLFDSHAIIVAE